MKHVIILACIIGTIIGSCSGRQNKQQIANREIGNEYTINYARGFFVEIHPDYKEVSVRNPWDTTKILQKYILIDKSREIPEKLPEGIIIRTPLTDVIAYSTIHCSSLNELNVLNSVKGVCESRYIDIPYIKEAVSNGKIVDLGEASNPDIEKVIDISPDAIFATPIQGISYGNITKNGIPMIETPDYMELTPLGRAEWVRFYSLFYNNEAYADSLFDITVKNYNSIKEKVASTENRPTVFLDLMNRGTWYIAGGNSFIAGMLNDAGALYIWHDDEKEASTPLPFEQILDKAGNAEFWLVKYNSPQDITYKSLEKEYKPYSYFNAFKNRTIYECNTVKRKYFEDLPIHPDLILLDFAYIFHPELFPDYIPRYYTRMKN